MTLSVYPLPLLTSPHVENPWLEFVELQNRLTLITTGTSASAPKLSPNSAARILDGRGRITQIVNNYSRISFNLARHCLSWME